ncbi:MAG TPA: copper amine oxidase N-terminal domain-containing protein [Candidatus Binatia bacterium]|nr:copper amine oxidase N-terminal domain-containing protein [Candidatus Binatia bacterium]
MLTLGSRILGGALLAALAVASLPRIAAAQTVTVTINGQPLYLSPGPIERAGRVFVPLRGIFERLGATVVYASGTINATKGPTTVSLQIGSTQATVSGQPQALDVAPFIVGATTYVPLRFIAQSLGAQVGYDGNTRVVAINMAQPVPPPPPRPPRPPVPPPYPPPSAVVRLRLQHPDPGANVRDRFTVISSEFTARVDAGSVRVYLDGNNITYRSGTSSTGFSYKPPAPLDFGSHTVRVTGRGPGGTPFDRSWSFAVIRSGPPPTMRLTITQPAPNSAVARTFTIAGNTVPNGHIRVTAGPRPSTTGQFSGETDAGPKGNFRMTVTLTTMPGQQAVSVRVVATDPVSGQSTETTLQLRLNQ